jgi:hypothetical protein
MQQDEQPLEEDDAYAPHGALADLCNRADQLRQAYEELHWQRGEAVASDQP